MDNYAKCISIQSYRNNNYRTVFGCLTQHSHLFDCNNQMTNISKMFHPNRLWLNKHDLHESSSFLE